MVWLGHTGVAGIVRDGDVIDLAAGKWIECAVDDANRIDPRACSSGKPSRICRSGRGVNDVVNSAMPGIEKRNAAGMAVDIGDLGVDMIMAGSAIAAHAVGLQRNPFLNLRRLTLFHGDLRQ